MWFIKFFFPQAGFIVECVMFVVVPAAQQLGIKFNEYSEDEFAMAVNMLYSDYCKSVGGDMMMYIKMAKAFLEDDDFDGNGSEKLALYYRCIAEQEQEQE